MIRIHAEIIKRIDADSKNTEQEGLENVYSEFMDKVIKVSLFLLTNLTNISLHFGT